MSQARRIVRYGGMLAATVIVGLTATACGSESSDSGSTATTGTSAAAAAPTADTAADTTTAAADAGGSPMERTLAFVDGGAKPADSYKVAYLASCTSNAYCQTQLKGMKEAAAKWGVDVKVFDANFAPDAERKNAQDAMSQGFDGYVLVPVAEASGCATYKMLKSTGKPVAIANSPICGNETYTPDTVGFVAMQTQSFFDDHVDNAFKSCQGPCELIALGGFVGSDLFTRWENAIKKAQAKYPDVKVVSDQPGNFDPRVALQKTQDALRAHPDAEVVLSSWDDMTRGAEQAIASAGKQPGKDVRIYSVGGTKTGVEAVKAGKWTETSVLLPFEETSFSLAQLVNKLANGEDTPGFTNLADAPPIVDGPKSVFITQDNAGTFTPEY